MSFDSAGFILFFSIIVLMYYIFPSKYKHIWLLIVSYYFYMCWDLKYVLVLIGITGITYVCAGMMKQGRKKLILAVCTILNLVILGGFKFWDFESIVVPVGISFYTLQALGYVIDVYREKVSPEKDIIKYALYVSFFPTIVSGPIERSTNLLKQIQKGTEISYSGIKKGLLLMGYGYFEKLLIANKISGMVNNAYEHYLSTTGASLAFAVFLYAIQIYVDFSGYSHIAIGAAKVLGFELKQNFNQPYFAKNIKEFWKRWHISLSSWLQDYVYISLGGSRKGKIRTYCNLMITFLVSAVWHGKGIKFLIWGGLHGMYQIAGRITERFRSGLLSKIGVKKENKIVCILQTCITFVMVDFAWLFFSASSTKDALVIIYRILTEFQFSKTMADKYYLLGTREESFVLLFLAVVILFIIDMIHERNISISDWIEKKHIIVRWTIYLMAALIVISGFIYNYGAEVTNFLYAQF